VVDTSEDWNRGVLAVMELQNRHLANFVWEPNLTHAGQAINGHDSSSEVGTFPGQVGDHLASVACASRKDRAFVD